MSTIGMAIINAQSNVALYGIIKASGYTVQEITRKDQLKNIDSLVISSDNQADFFQLCEWLINVREMKGCFVWVYTPKFGDQEREAFLQLGANAVIDNPDRIGEISFLIKNTQARLMPLINQNAGFYPLVLNELNMSIVLDGESEVLLTRLEYQIISLLYRNANTTVTYEQISLVLWEGKLVRDQNYRITNLIFHLRRKLGSKGEALIQTVRSKGYLLVL